MEILIDKLNCTDLKDLYNFELENRTFFEKMVPTRGEDYYRPDVFKLRHKSLLEEQAEGISYFYLIKDEKGSILGRINVIDVDASHKIGNLGYRVG